MLLPFLAVEIPSRYDPRQVRGAGDQKENSMSEEPDDLEDQPNDAEDVTAAAAAITAAVHNVAGAGISENLRRIANEALGGHSHLADLVDAGNSFVDHSSIVGKLYSEAGLDRLPGVQAAMDAVSRAAAGWGKGEFGRLSDMVFGGHSHLADLVDAGNSFVDHSSIVGKLYPEAGPDRLPGVQAAMDAVSRAAGGWANTNRELGRLSDPMFGGHRHLADMVGAGNAFTDRTSIFGKLYPEAGRDRLPGVRAAMDAMAGHQSTFDRVRHQFDIGLDRLTGLHAAPGRPWSSGELSRWAGGALGGHQRALNDLIPGNAVAGYTSPFEKLMRDSHRSIQEIVGRSSLIPDPATWMKDVIRGPGESIAEVMRSWWPLADRGLRAAQAALRAALKVVALLKRNDPKAPEAVKRFLLDWLGFQFSSWNLVCSATLVLLDIRSWLPEGMLSSDYDPCPQLRKLTLAEHRSANRLSIDPSVQLQGKPLLSLDQPVRVTDTDDAPTPLRDLVPDKEAPEPGAVDDGEISDPRILRLWWKFTDREREIVREKSHPRMTWSAAAVACGGSPAEGDRIRRKVKRLAKSATTSAPAAVQAG
jgi:hypothetical protein